MAITFHIGIHASSTTVNLVLSDEEYQQADLSSHYWKQITVASEIDMQMWLAAKNRWLYASRAPIRDTEERLERTETIAHAELIMQALELSNSV